MATREERKQYAQDLAAGRLFEDFAAEVLYDHGLVVGLYRSRRYQFEVGESRAGVEFKNDRKWRETGNLFIEIRARASADKEFHPSGPFRNDNALLLAIGDSQKFWLLSMRKLLFMEQDLPHIDCYTGRGGTRFQSSEGVLLGVDLADLEAIAIFEQDENKFCGDCGRVKRKGVQ